VAPGAGLFVWDGVDCFLCEFDTFVRARPQFVVDIFAVEQPDGYSLVACDVDGGNKVGISGDYGGVVYGSFCG